VKIAVPACSAWCVWAWVWGCWSGCVHVSVCACVRVRICVCICVCACARIEVWPNQLFNIGVCVGGKGEGGGACLSLGVVSASVRKRKK